MRSSSLLTYQISGGRGHIGARKLNPMPTNNSRAQQRPRPVTIRPRAKPEANE